MPAPRLNAPPPTLLGKLIALLIGTALLVAGLMASLVIAGVALVAGIGLWVWIRWKTRALRQTMAEAQHQAPAGTPRHTTGREEPPHAAASTPPHGPVIIEGSAVRVDDPASPAD